MIPSSAAFLEQELTITDQPTYTYKMNFDSNSIRGHINKQEAVIQAIYKILNTERYQYVMYSWDYGIELQDLYGEPISYVCPELERRISEALTWDDRIQSVDDFEFDTSRKGEILVKFTVHTVFGDVAAEKKVSI